MSTFFKKPQPDFRGEWTRETGIKEIKDAYEQLERQHPSKDNKQFKP